MAHSNVFPEWGTASETDALRNAVSKVIVDIQKTTGPERY
jgi:hypothetical protein